MEGRFKKKLQKKDHKSIKQGGNTQRNSQRYGQVIKYLSREDGGYFSALKDNKNKHLAEFHLFDGVRITDATYEKIADKRKE